MTILPEDNKQTLLAAIIAFVLTPAGLMLLGACLAAGIAAAAAAYSYGKDVGTSAAASYKAANDLKLPDLISETSASVKSIKEASNELRQAAAEVNAISDAKKRAEALSLQIAAQTDEIAALRKSKDQSETTNAQLQATISGLRAQLERASAPVDHVQVRIDASVTVYKRMVTVGYFTRDTVKGPRLLNINNDEYEITPGKIIPVIIPRGRCQLTVDAVQMFEAVFSLSCQEDQ